MRSHVAHGTPVKVGDYVALPGGYSNVMGRFEAALGEEAGFLVRRSDQPAGHALVTSDREVEWEVTRHLRDRGLRCLPQPRFIDVVGEFLGTPTIISDFLEGDTLTARVEAADDAQKDDLTEQLVDLLAEVHTAPLEGLAPIIRMPASWDSYLTELIAAWRQVESQHLESNPFLTYVAAWLDNDRPPAAPLAMVHGDMQASNLLVTSAGLVAVDWEFSHVGDPREDLGWLQMMESLSPLRLYSRDPVQFCRRYCRRTGWSEEIINPATVAYFSVLAVVRVFQMLYQQIAAMARGENDNMAVAYSATVALTRSHSEWLQVISRLRTAVS